MITFKIKHLFLTLLFTGGLISAVSVACGVRGSEEGDVRGVSVIRSLTETGPAFQSPSTESNSLGPIVGITGVQDLHISSKTDTEPDSYKVSLNAEAVLAAQEEVLIGIYESVLPSVVQINIVEMTDATRQNPIPDIPPQFRRFFDFPESGQGRLPADRRRIGEGSGFLWDDYGHVVTNHHVVTGADRVTVTFADGLDVEANVLGSDISSDIAVLKVDIPGGHRNGITLADSSKLHVGQITVAIGNPFGQEFSMSSGIVSALGRTIRNTDSRFSNPQIIQTDAAINPGNSGSPLLDRLGRVIGINSQIISPSGTSAGVGFAIPVNTAKRIVPEIIAKGEYKHAYLGISGMGLTSRHARANNMPNDSRGVIVTAVEEDGPSDIAGVRGSDDIVEIDGESYLVGGDVIIAIDGVKVDTVSDLIGYVAENKTPGDISNLEIIRSGQVRVALDVTLTTRPISNNRFP